MPLSRTLVDKLTGTVCLAGSAVSVTVGLKSVGLLVRGPSRLQRLLALVGLGSSIPVAAFGLYVGSYLVRYPPERHTTAAEIARVAAQFEARLMR